MYLRLKRGALVALEGPNGVGKSTQARELKRILGPSGVVVTHQPSGAPRIGQLIYDALQGANGPQSHLARQLLHLASHAEHYETEILPALQGMGVILDRCWWSTVAYGYFGSNIGEWISYEDFERLAILPSRGKVPDLVLLSLDVRTRHSEVSASVLEGYRFLRSRFNSTTVELPNMSEARSTQFVLSQLRLRALLEVKE